MELQVQDLHTEVIPLMGSILEDLPLLIQNTTNFCIDLLDVR